MLAAHGRAASHNIATRSIRLEGYNQDVSISLRISKVFLKFF